MGLRSLVYGFTHVHVHVSSPTHHVYNIINIPTNKMAAAAQVSTSRSQMQGHEQVLEPEEEVGFVWETEGFHEFLQELLLFYGSLERHEYVLDLNVIESLAITAESFRECLIVYRNVATPVEADSVAADVIQCLDGLLLLLQDKILDLQPSLKKNGIQVTWPIWAQICRHVFLE